MQSQDSPRPNPQARGVAAAGQGKMAALTTVVVAAAATAVAGAVAGTGAATGTGVGAAPVPQQVNGGGPQPLVAGVGPRGQQAPETERGPRPSLSRCPLRRGRGRREAGGAALPPCSGLAHAWRCALFVRAFHCFYQTKPPPCSFGVEDDLGGNPGPTSS